MTRSLALILDHRYQRDDSGQIFSIKGLNHEYFSSRYRSVFPDITVVARLDQGVSTYPRLGRSLIGEGVRFCEMPYFRGGFAALFARKRITRFIWEAVDSKAVICYAPSVCARLVRDVCHSRGYPFGVEIGGDPESTFTGNAAKVHFRPLWRWLAMRSLRMVCRDAAVTNYVTRDALQRKYPPGRPGRSFSSSKVELPADMILAEPRQLPAAGPLEFIGIGMLDQPYKGCDVFLRIVKRLRDSGKDIRGRWVGGGSLLDSYVALAAELGLSDQVRFTGAIPAGAGVFAQIDSAQVMLMSSRQEGLPRAMIEAMGRGLPCFGSRVGGVGELLPDARIFTMDDVEGGVRCILDSGVFTEQGYSDLSRHSLETARRYSSEALLAERLRFYAAVRDLELPR